MKKEIKERIIIFCTGIPLAAFPAGIVHSLLTLAHRVYIRGEGWPPWSPIAEVPQGMDLVSLTIGNGVCAILFPLLPALLTTITFHVVRRTPLGTHVLTTTCLSLLLGFMPMLFSSTLAKVMDWEITDYIVCPLTCEVIVLLVELLMKKKLQTKVALRSYLPFVLAWVVLVALHAAYYTASTVAQAGPSDPEYMRFCGFQLFAFAFFRLPFWFLALAASFGLRAVYLCWNSAPGRR